MPEETGNTSKISIWWDIENCHVPKDVDPHYIAQNVTAALHRASLTGPIEIQVFGDTTILPHSTQKALSDTGITLNHVPRGNKDAADKAILVAMLLWALDNPPPANILLISGDGDFANALHRLRLKTYSILLAIPAQFVKPALTGAGKKLWLWKEMAQGQLAELKLSQGNGDTSSIGPVGLSWAMDRSSSMNVLATTHSSSVSDRYVPLPARIAELEVGSASEHIRSLSLENHPSSYSSTDNRNRSHVAENAQHHIPSDRQMSPGGSSDSSASNRLNSSQSQPHVLGRSSSADHSMGFGQYPYFLPGAGEKGESLDPTTSTAMCNTPKDSRSSQFSSMPMGPMPMGPLKHIAHNNNRGAINESPVKNTDSDKKVDQNVLPCKHRNANNNIPNSGGPATSTPHSNGMMSNSQKTPRSRRRKTSTLPSNAVTQKPTTSTAPSNAMMSNPQNLPPSCQPTTSTAPSNPMMSNPQNLPPSWQPTTSTPPSNSMMSNPQKLPPSCRPTTSALPSNAMMSNSQDMSGDACLDKIYSAMKTLERDMLAPTESNLSDCIQYWDPEHARVDVKQALHKAAELQQITKTQLGGGLVMFFPPERRVPWNCVDPGNMHYNHSSDVWLELRLFLLYSDKKQGFLSSCSRYDAAIILKNCCAMHIQSLVVGQIVNLLQQALQVRKWLRKNGPGLVLNQKILLDWSGDETQKGNRKPSTQIANPHSNSESVLDRDIVLIKLRDLFSLILKESAGYNLSLLPNDFEHATGSSLNYQKLGYANLQELMKEFTDVAYVEATNSGLLLLYPVKPNENVVGLRSNIADKENDDKAIRQIQVVRELKSWLSHFISTVKDGYDISKVQDDFLQASGRDLKREGLDFNKTQCILNRFRDVIRLTRTSGGLWLAYPAS